MKVMLNIGNKEFENTPLQMIGYKQVGKIKSFNQKQSIVKKLCSDTQYVPKQPSDSILYYTPENLDSYSLTTIGREASSIAAKPHLKHLRNYLDSTLKKGQKLIKIQWEYKGNTIFTTAVVDDKKGIIYDNIITNSLVVKKSHNTNIGQTITSMVVMKNGRVVKGTRSHNNLIYHSEFNNRMISPFEVNDSTKHGTYTIYWVVYHVDQDQLDLTDFGFQLAHAEANFDVDGKVIAYANPQESPDKEVTGYHLGAIANGTLVNTLARKHIFRFKKGPNGYAQGAYAIALSAPEISISATYYPDYGYKVTFGSTFSLAHGKATASDYFSADQFMVPNQ
jgi:hypothetical protein